MFRLLAALLTYACLAMLALPPAAFAQGNCANCDLPPGCRGNGNQRNKPECQRIDLTIQTDLDFGRVLIFGDGVGTVVIDLATGRKLVEGELDDYGGLAVTGHAVITGSPNRLVRISFPSQVSLRDPAGGEARVDSFESDLPSLALLDNNGQLEFNFTGTLHTTDLSAIGGRLRGRFPIRVEYD